MNLQPYVWPEAFEQPVVLYQGALRLHFGDDTIEGVGQVICEWRPKPGVRYRFASADSQAIAFLHHGPAQATRVEPLETAHVVPQPPEGATPLEAESLMRDGRYTAEGDVPSQEFGARSDEATRVVFHVVNFVDGPLPEIIDTDTQHYLGRLTLSGEHWQVVIERPPDKQAQFKSLKRYGGYAITHVAELRRADGAAFAINDTEEVQDALFHLLGFVRGALVGVALPVAYAESGEAVWSAWRTTIVTPWTNTINWCDWTHFHELDHLWGSWLQKSEDSFWREVLKRAVRHCLDANVPNPVDSAIVVSHSALELLAWAVLVVEHRWLDPKDGDLATAGRIRLLLRWAGIDSAIDPRLTALQRLAKRENCIDGPDALAFVRNRIVHPPRRLPKGAPSWPSWGELVESWRLAMEYAELVLLRILDYEGEYGTRFHTEGRWPGQTQSVPWAMGAEQ